MINDVTSKSYNAQIERMNEFQIQNTQTAQSGQKLLATLRAKEPEEIKVNEELRRDYGKSADSGAESKAAEGEKTIESTLQQMRNLASKTANETATNTTAAKTDTGTDSATSTQVATTQTASEGSGAAATASRKLDAAISRVTAARSSLGAVQNRLQSTISNMTVAGENLTAAETRVRDVDMANEMMDYSKYNILNQQATAMLAQANSAPQQVLQLLGG